MTIIDELCQLIRQLNMNQFRAELERMRDGGFIMDIQRIQTFLENCYRQPK